MADMDEILGLFSQPDYKSDYLDAKATETCIKCKRPVGSFRNNASRFEYQISALCQECQDIYFRDRTRDTRDREQKVGNGD
jgi:hypothetical protein